MANKIFALIVLSSLIMILLLFLSHNFNTLFPIQEEYRFNQTVKEFSPILEFKIENESLKKAEATLISYKSVSCPENYPISCRGICYQKCEIGYLECYENKTGKCVYYQPNVSYLYDKLIEAFVNYECEDKVDVESLKSFTVSLLPNYGASVFPYLLYNFQIYKWIKENIRYLPGSYSEAMLPTKTLELKAGKCDDQAILFASMSASIGSVVRVRYVEGCQHAWSEVFFPTRNVEGVINELSFYSNEKEFQYFEVEDGIWIPFDTTYEVGRIAEDCLNVLNTSTVKYYCKNPCKKEYPFYYKDSCYSKCPGGTGIGSKGYLCLECPNDYPFTYNNKCVNACPNGTGLASDNKTCIECPPGYQTFNNICVGCPEGFYIGKDGKCYKKL
jgi:hypothetical protein